MRKRFAAALQWFAILRDRAEIRISNYIAMSKDDEAANIRTDLVTPSTSSSGVEPPPSEDLSSNTPEQANVRDRPSDYLRRRCPACFGGECNERCAECTINVNDHSIEFRLQVFKWRWTAASL